jgi:hypothetical protein
MSLKQLRESCQSGAADSSLPLPSSLYVDPQLLEVDELEHSMFDADVEGLDDDDDGLSGGSEEGEEDEEEESGGGISAHLRQLRAADAAFAATSSDGDVPDLFAAHS